MHLHPGKIGWTIMTWLFWNTWPLRKVTGWRGQVFCGKIPLCIPARHACWHDSHDGRWIFEAMDLRGDGSSRRWIFEAMDLRGDGSSRRWVFEAMDLRAAIISRPRSSNVCFAWRGLQQRSLRRELKSLSRTIARESLPDKKKTVPSLHPTAVPDRKTFAAGYGNPSVLLPLFPVGSETPGAL